MPLKLSTTLDKIQNLPNSKKNRDYKWILEYIISNDSLEHN